jgi:hypothetical protein
MTSYSLLVVGAVMFICGLVLGFAAPYIYDPGITAAMPQITIPHTTTEQEKIDYCSKLSGDGDAISMAWNHECVYNCTIYWPNPCLDHGWHYEKGATSIHVRDTILVTPTPFQDNPMSTMPHLVTFHIYPEGGNQLVKIDLQGHVQDFGYTDNKSEVVFPMLQTEVYNITFCNCSLKVVPYEDTYSVWCHHV